MSARVVLGEDGKLEVEGSITINSVAKVVGQGVTLLARGNGVIDLTLVTEVDSTAVSMLLEWQREAIRCNSNMLIINVPQNLLSLMRLYGVSELMNMA